MMCKHVEVVHVFRCERYTNVPNGRLPKEYDEVGNFVSFDAIYVDNLFSFKFLAPKQEDYFVFINIRLPMFFFHKFISW